MSRWFLAALVCPAAMTMGPAAAAPAGGATAGTQADAPLYEVKENDGLAKLVVTVGGKAIATKIEDASVRVEAVADFDGDGQPDALVANDCMGNGCLVTSSIVTVKAGKVVVAEIGEAPEPAAVVSVFGAPAVALTDVEGVRTFALHGGKAAEVAYDASPALKPLTTVEGLDGPQTGEAPPPQLLKVDVDGDGKPEAVRCAIWERWGSLVCSLPTPGGGVQELSTGCERFGPLPVMSQGRRMFACGRNQVVRFDGKRWQVGPWRAAAPAANKPEGATAE
ncbi:MAG: hypothetical protein KC613_21880 [Myxococcales bacterium]|nr:hypothetical protein [Myxococcales bacterium]MCB9524193.1 hypothetical protein [Myxococcales bacterium]